MGSRLPALAGVALLVAAACGSSTRTGAPSPSGSATAPLSGTATAAPSQADLQIYATIETQVEGLRDLQPKTPVSPTLLDEAGVRHYMENAAQTENDHVALAMESRLFVHMGLLPAGSSLEQMEIDLQSGQVIGFYDFVTKKLYLLSQSGGVGAMQKWTFSHEFTHALQDQNFGLDRLAIDTVDQGDRDLARTSLAEGDAMIVTNAWTTRFMTMKDALDLLAQSQSDPSTAQLAAAPAILRGNLMFPYEQGLAFVQRIYDQGGWPAVNALYENPPNSSSQILHPELYTSGVQPVTVKLPAVPSSLGSGWKLSGQDTMGEYQLGLWLQGEHPTAAEKSAAESAVSTWAGDRIGLYEGPNGKWAVALRTTWRTVGGQVDFQGAAAIKAASLSGKSRVCGSGMGVDVILASDAATLAAFATC